MHIFFSHPVFWLTAIVVVPLLIHLFSKMKPKDRSFSSLIFLQDIIQKQSRLKRPKDWLLWILRSMAFLSLAMAFTLPFIAGENKEARALRSVVLIVDRSSSMSATEDNESRLNKAGVFAEQIIRDLKPGDMVNLIWIDAQPTALFKEPKTAHELVSRELQRIHSLPQEGDVASALDLARQQFDKDDQRERMVYIISDFQESQWKGQKWNELFPEKVAVHYISVAKSPLLPNTAITDVRVIPSKVLPGQPVRVRVFLSQFDSSSARVTVHLESGISRSSALCEIPAQETSSVDFLMEAPKSSEPVPVSISIDNDAFPTDNSAHCVIQTTPNLLCNAIASDPMQLGFLGRGLKVLPYLKTQFAAGVSKDIPDYTVWLRPTVEDISEVQNLATQGSTVLILPDFSGDSAVNTLMGSETTQRAESEYSSEKIGWRMKRALPDDPAYRLFPQTKEADPLHTHIFQRLNKGLNIPEKSTQIIARYEDDIPAIVRKPLGKGALILWNIPINERDTTWGSSPLFLPFLGEVLLSSAQEGLSNAPLTSGKDYLEYSPPAIYNAAQIILTDKEGRTLPLQTDVAQGRHRNLISMNTAAPGLYTWKNEADQRTVHIQTVPFPAHESPLISLAPNELPPNASGVEQASTIPALIEKIELWPWLLGLALLLFMIELTLCTSLIVTRKNASIETGKEAQP